MATLESLVEDARRYGIGEMLAQALIKHYTMAEIEFMLKIKEALKNG